MSEKDLYQLFENVILHRDSEDLLNFLSSEESSTNDVNVVITYLGNCFDDCLNCLPEREITITNALSFLGDFIQVVSLDVDQSAFLSKCMIQLAAQEDCIIQIIKRVVYTLNMLLSSEKVGALLIKDETLDGPIQIFGRRISFIGDYECQALILESLYRLGADKSSKTYWTNVWFQSNKLRSMFLNLNPQQFEMDCRNILNHINREEFSQRIYSFVAISAFFGHSQLKKPNGSEFWFDFNYDSQSISFYCCEFSDENNENSAWETIVIPIDIIKNYTVSDLTTLKIKEIILYLNCSCNDLAPDDSKSEIFESNEVKIRYWSCLDVSKHLKKLFGNDELSSNEKLNGPERKVSENSNIFKNNEEKETTSQRSRKVSEIKSFVKMDELDTQKVENPSKSKRKISETGLLIKEHFDEDIKNHAESRRKISEVCDLINDSAEEPTELHRFQEIKLTPVHDLKETNLDQEAQKSDAEKTLPTGEYHNLTDKKNSIEDSRKMSVEEIGEKLYSTGHIKSSDEDLIPFEKPSNERVEEIVDEPYLNGHFDNSDEDFIPQTEPPSKKPRKAAVRATKKNKLILEQKESEKDSTCTCEDPKIKSDIMNNKKQNHIISQKRKKNGPSSQADGETGSSEVSWYKRAKYGLFHTPPMKNYSKKSLRKQKQIKDKEVKRNYRKSCKLKRQKKGNALGNKSTDSESKSRSMKLSDIENYSLIIESKNESKISRKTARESNFQSDLLNSINEMLPSSQTQHNVNDEDFNNYCLTEKSFEDSVLGSETFEDVRNHNKSDIEHNSNHAKVRNVKKRIRKHVQSATDFIHPILSCDKDALLYSTNSYVNHEEQKSKIRHVNSDNVEKSNIYEENNKVFSNKTSKLEDNVPKLKTKDCHSKIAKVSKKRSETLPAKNKEKRFKNIPISEETLVELSPVFNSKPQISENLFSNSLSSKNSSSNVERVQENVCINLSFESLCSLPDEKNGKELHMQKFLESLSGDSPTQIDVEVYSVASAASLKRVHEDCLSKNDIPHKKYKTDSSDLEEKELKSKLSVSTSNDIEVDGSYNFKNQFIESNTLSSIKSEILCSTKLNALSTCPDSNIIYLEKQKYFPKSSPIHNFKSEKLVQKPTKKRQHFTKGSLKNFDIDMKSCDSKQKRNVSHFKKYPIRDNLSLLKEKKMTAGTIFTILASEINSLTKMLCGTLQKYAVEFSTKITALRKNMVKTMERMISCNPDFNKKNLRNLAQSCKENRLQIQEDVNKLLEIGKEYFEAERENERKLKRLHKKIAYKYAFNAKIVEKVAVKSVEEKIIMKTRSVFKKLLRNMEKL